MKLVHKDLRFFFSFMKTELKFFHAIDVCAFRFRELCCFYLGIELFFFIHLSSCFFIEPRRMPLQTHPQCLPALLENMISPGSVFTYFTSCVWWECVKCAPTRLICWFSCYWCVCFLLLLLVWSVRGSTGLEKACIQGPTCG